MLSVTFDCMVIVSVALNMVSFAGLVIFTDGASTSCPTKKVVSVLLILFEVSFAKKSTV